MTDFFFFYCSQTASSSPSQTIGAKTFMESDFFPITDCNASKKNLIMLKPMSKRITFQMTKSGMAYRDLTKIIVLYHKFR